MDVAFRVPLSCLHHILEVPLRVLSSESVLAEINVANHLASPLVVVVLFWKLLPDLVEMLLVGGRFENVFRREVVAEELTKRNDGQCNNEEARLTIYYCCILFRIKILFS